MSQELMIASILNGLTGGFTKGMEIRQARDKQVSDEAVKQKMLEMEQQKVDMDKSKQMSSPSFENFQIDQPYETRVSEWYKAQRPPKEANITDLLKEQDSQRRMDQALLGRYDKMMRDPRWTKLLDAGQNIESTKTLIDQAQGEGKNTVATAALGANMKRVLEGGGQATDQDVVRYITSKKWSQNISDKFKMISQGVPTTATLDEIKKITEAMEAAIAKRSEKVQGEYIRQTANTFKRSESEIKQRWGLISDTMTTQEPIRSKANNNVPVGITPEDAIAELQRRKKGAI